MKIVFLKDNNCAPAYDNDIIIGKCNFIINNETWNIIHIKVDKLLWQCIINKSQEYNVNFIANCSYAKNIK